MAETSTITFHRAEAKTLRFTYAAGSGSIAAWSITFVLREGVPGGTVLVTKTVGSGVTIIDAANRIFEVVLTAANTNRPEGKYTFAAFRTDPGNETMLAEGVLTLKQPPALAT